MRRRGLTKSDIEELETKIRRRDPIADRAGKPTFHGRIEAIENASFPWLAERRQRRRPAQD